jgi:pimeloyl-ACP methyl ester carboxylesterase
MRYRFGTCELDTERHELLVDGESRSVEPQVFDVLAALVGRAGALVSQDELIEAVWGGRIVSDSAISARISAARAAIGDDGKRQALIRTVPRKGFRFVGTLEDAAPVPAAETSDRAADSQRIRFCRSADATRVAHATTGDGPPLVRAGHWLTHLEHDWHSPIWRPLLNGLGRHFRVTRYDQRGNGLSDWDVEDFSLDRLVEDLEAVVEAAGLERFALYGSSQGVPIGIAYATRHPEKVSHLVLQGGYARGRLVRGNAADREQGEALLTMIRHGWGQAGSPFIQAFATMFIPDGTKEEIASLTELQRISTSPENAARIRAAIDAFDVSDLLASVAVPTLVLHARHDGVQPLEQGRELAAGIPGADFVELDSADHALLAHEPAWQVLFEEIRRFCLAEAG